MAGHHRRSARRCGSTAMGRHRRRPPDDIAARHRVRRRDGRDDRRARRRRHAPTSPTTACTWPSRRCRTTACSPTSRSTTCSPAAATARCSAPSQKRHPADFVLWKLAKPGEPSWPSPWGDGRPGWHSECVVMSLDLLGEGFDLHCGGQDLRFPHHENERAQAVALGKRFANHWMHHGFVVDAEGEKMSKSLGNVDNLLDLLDALRRARVPDAAAAEPLPQPGQRRRRQPRRRGRTALAGLDAFAAPHGRRSTRRRRRGRARRVPRARWTTTSTRRRRWRVLFDTVRRANAALDAGDADAGAARRRGARDAPAPSGSSSGATGEVPADVRGQGRRARRGARRQGLRHGRRDPRRAAGRRLDRRDDADRDGRPP